MSNYIDDLAADIGLEVPDCPIELLRLYALLALVKGTDVTLEDVHNAWATWISATDPHHRSAIPFEFLTAPVQQSDRPYMEAIRRVASDVETGP